MDIKLYTLSYCDICLFLKDELKAIGIDFEEIYCDKNPTIAKLIQNKLATENYPIVCVEGVELKLYFIYGNSSPIRQIANDEYFTHYESIKHLTHLIKLQYEK